MTFAEKLLQLRKRDGYTQETLAEMLNVSRQTVSRWEMGTAVPDSSNLLNISKLFGVSVDYLLNEEHSGGNDSSVSEEKNRILHMNLTLIAIIAQVSFLNAAMRPFQRVQTPYMKTVEILIKTVPLLASSVWMAYNLRFEKDALQYRKNVRTELVYCTVQACIFLFGRYSGLYRLGTAGLIAVSMIYIFAVNPKYMNRKLVKTKK